MFGLRHRWTYFLRTLPDIAPFLEPLERAIADLLVPAITEHVTTQEERDLLELPVRLGGLGLVNPARTASQEYEASVKITGPLVRQIIKQAHEPPDETEIKTLQASARREKDELLKMQCEQVRESLPGKTERAVELATEKGASNWLTVIPIKEMNFNLNKRGCAIQTQIRIESCLRNRYSNYMKMRRRGNTAGEFWKWSKGHSHH